MYSGRRKVFGANQKRILKIYIGADLKEYNLQMPSDGSQG